ncbi:MAG TPA: protein kinase [Polyangiales bacterium]|nr:protein kinase [Polyangiales bacterium]
MGDETTTAPASPPGSGEDGSRYELLRPLGTGGAGAVYLARDRETGEQFALKKLFRMDAKSVLRLKREFRSLADINHPNIVKLYELGRASDAWFLTMEYLDGCELESYVRGAEGAPANQNAELPHERVLSAFHQLACGVHALHGAGMLHRDLKPSNVMIEKGRVVVLDFGLVRELDRSAAKVTEEGSVAGTPAYMAPEQALGRPLTAACDWYAFGVMLYQALSGELPFDGSSFEILRNKLAADPPPLEQLVADVPANVSALCMGLLRREENERPGGDQVLSVLDAARVKAKPQAQPVPPTVDTTQYTETQTGTRLPPLFGREDELAALWSALSSTEDGSVVFAHVRGASGAGKSALIEHFLDEIEHPSGTQADALTLRSRCYEREAMPFKALDGVIDALVNHMSQLDDLHTGHLLPAEVGALAQLFPVLGRLKAVQRLVGLSKPRGDAVQLRQRAELALRDLFGRLATHQPLVIWIDDLQWGDLDSAAILKDWLEDPPSAPILFVLSYRAAEVATSTCLRQLLEGGSEAPAKRAKERTVDVAPLAAADIDALCAQRLGVHAQSHPELLAHIVRESQGSPFLAIQLTSLAQAKLARGEADVRDVSVDVLVAQTSALLPAGAQKILQVLAVAGRPMQPRLVLRAAGVAQEGRALVHGLRGLNLVRTRDVGGERLLEVYHDRIRERVHGALGAEDRRAVNSALLSTLEYSGQGDPDWLYSLALGAEQPELALRHGLVAAERANVTLAFARAVELYQACLQLMAADSPEIGELWVRLADALARLGRGNNAADAYLEASKRATGEPAAQWMREAMSHLLRSGRFDEGEVLLRKVLATLQLEVPESDGGLIAAIVWERARLKLRGLGYRKREEAEVARETLLRIDLCDTIASEIQSFDAVRAALFQSRSLRLSLEAGEPKRVVRALTRAATTLAQTEGSRSQKEVLGLLDRAEALAREINSEWDYALTRGNRAVAAFMFGAHENVLEPSYEAERVLLANSEGHVHDTYYARFAFASIRLGAMLSLGLHERFLSEFHAVLQEARNTENVHAQLLLVLNHTLAEEMAGHPRQSLPRLEQQRTQLPKGAFGPLHALLMQAVMRVACTTHEYGWASELIKDDWERFLAAPVRRSVLMRAFSHTMHSRYVMNQWTVEGRAGDLGAAVREDLSVLAKSPLPWCALVVQRTEARLAYRRGDKPKAIALLRANLNNDRGGGHMEISAYDRYALGLLVGGTDGEALCAGARADLQKQVPVEPEVALRWHYPELLPAVK